MLTLYSSEKIGYFPIKLHRSSASIIAKILSYSIGSDTVRLPNRDNNGRLVTHESEAKTLR